MGSKKKLLALGGFGAVLGSLCCITPLVIVLFGLGGVTFAAGLGNTLYFQYRWVFWLIGLGFVFGGLLVYFRGKGVCNLDQAKRKKKFIINTTILTVVSAVLIYMVFNYVFLEYIGSWVGIWDLPSFYPGA